MTNIYKDYRPETKSLVLRLREAGWYPVAADDGEDVVKVADVGIDGAVDHACGVDEANFTFVNADQKKLRVYLVFGNEPGVVASDYGCPPELMDTIDGVIAAHEESWARRKQPMMELSVGSDGVVSRRPL
jgi:hypothetical protein